MSTHANETPKAIEEKPEGRDIEDFKSICEFARDKSLTVANLLMVMKSCINSLIDERNDNDIEVTYFGLLDLIKHIRSVNEEVLCKTDISYL